jgi:hypothetical protein
LNKFDTNLIIEKFDSSFQFFFCVELAKKQNLRERVQSLLSIRQRDGRTDG